MAQIFTETSKSKGDRMNTATTNSFEPGTYWIGDLCYVLQADEWDDLMTLTRPARLLQATTPGYRKSQEETVVELRGSKLGYCGTAYGDGVYMDEERNLYPVDSGSIGIVPLERVKVSDKILKILDALGRIIQMTESFSIENQHGRLRFGNVFIDTDFREFE